MNTQNTPHTLALLKACEIAGSKAALAAALGVSAQRVDNWINRDRTIPAEFCTAIEKQFGVLRRDLRPNDYWLVWPDLPQQEASHA